MRPVVDHPARYDPGRLGQCRRTRGRKTKEAEEQNALSYAAQADEQTVLPTATEKSALADLFQLEC
jgi:hypothetical protein